MIYKETIQEVFVRDDQEAYLADCCRRKLEKGDTQDITLEEYDAYYNEMMWLDMLPTNEVPF